MAQITGGAALVKSLRNLGVEAVFGLPGAQFYYLYDALFDESNAIKTYSTRHEQGAGYMAMGYAQASGKIGVYAVVPGVGFLNSAAALATAYSAGTPVLCLAGENPLPMIGRGFGLLHELPDQLGILDRLTKWAARAEHASEVPGLVREAFARAAHGRPRPVALELPTDILEQSTSTAPADGPLDDLAAALGPGAPDPDAVARAAKLLGKAENPAIYVGGGIHGAGAPLLELAEALQAPIVMTRNGYGVVSDRHYLAQRLPVGHRLWPENDVVLAVGTRFVPYNQWGRDDGLKIVRVDADPLEITRAGPPAVGIRADAALTLRALVDAVGKHNRKRASIKDRLTALEAELESEYARVTPQHAYLKVIRDELPDDGIFVEEVTQLGYFARYALPIYEPRTYITSGYQGTLGFGYATALGAQVGAPGRQVVAISGDGGFLYTATELATAVQYGLNVVCIVLNDDGYGNVRRSQREEFGGRVIGSDLTNPDFVKMAESFGAAGYRADTPDALRSALRSAFKGGAPAVISVPAHDFGDPWRHMRLPRVRPAGAKSDISVRMG